MILSGFTASAINAEFEVAQREIKKEVEKAVEALKKIGVVADKKERKKLLKRGAVVMRNEIRSNAPVSQRLHKRYSTSKAAKNLKAGKGQGNVVATYSPGNLKRSIRLLNLRKSADWFVGPKVSRVTKGDFTGNRVDGYYAHFVEYGAPGAGVPATPFIRPAVSTGRSKVAKAIKRSIKKRIRQIVRQVKVK